MTVLTDLGLYLRGAETLLASWEENARGAVGAAVRRFPGVAVAIFPTGPERSVYNNALLDRDLGAAAGADALDVMEGAYASAGVSSFAAWVHESDEAMRGEIQRRGYTLAESTRAMGMALADIRVPRPELGLAPPTWDAYLEHLAAFDIPEGLLAGADPSVFRIVLARFEGAVVATGLSFDLGDDCGIYNVGTLERARRRGIGTAVTALLAYDAASRGCRTASLQSTEIAERVYTSVGFRDLGRILEYGL